MRATAGGFLVGLFAGGALVLGLLAGQERVASHITQNPASPSGTMNPAASLQPSRTPRVADVFLVLRRVTATKSGGDTWDAALLVRDGVARQIPLPAEVDHTVAPMTDGERVYAYVQGNRERGVGPVRGPASNGVGRRGRRLVAFTLDGREDETISDSTDLVEPRGLFASPNGTTLAFFLDNRQTIATELWTYDAVARSKRVAVERLVRGALTGPVFAPDGTLLLRAGTQLFRWSTGRSRADVVPVVLEDHVQWDAGVALSPDGGRVALVVHTPEGNAVESRVRVYPLGAASPTTRFSTIGELEVLAWLTPEEILIRQSDELLLLHGEDPQITRLTADAVSVRVGGDYRTLASLEQSDGRIEIATMDLSQDVRHTIPLPPLSSRSPPSVLPSGAPVPQYVLVQYLRVGNTPGSKVGTDLEAARPEEVLRLVSEQIRVIADAPPGEPVTAERVWFTSTPRTVYVDYRVGTTLWRRLVRVPATRNTESVATVLGVFAPTDGSWVLTRGIDLADSAPVALFEFEPSVAQWITKPLVYGAAP